MVVLLLLAGAWPAAQGHGGMVWPPIWQDGNYLGLDEVHTNKIMSNPPVRDPKTNRTIDNTKSWSTDQAYTGGHGPGANGTGAHYNFDHCSTKLEYGDYACGLFKHPWAAPGVATVYGGGCGIHGGNPYGCPAHSDTRPPGSQCMPDEDRGTWSYGSSALEIDFPQAAVTRWARGATVPVGFVAIYHGGGYTYRLCKLPPDGKYSLSEPCFQRNILEFAEDRTYWRDSSQWSRWYSINGTGNNTWNDNAKWIDNSGQKWKTEPKSDLTEGTYPLGSAWRYIGPIDKQGWMERIYKDLVKVPEDLEPGQYVLSWRWDAVTAPQIWVSCANIEIVA